MSKRKNVTQHGAGDALQAIGSNFAPQANSTQDPLHPLRSHSSFAPIAEKLKEHVGVERDLIQWTQFLSLASGRMSMPINLEVVTGDLEADLGIASRILDISPKNVARVDTLKDYRALERARFMRLSHSQDHQGSGGQNQTELPSHAISVIEVRRNRHQVFPEVLERLARYVSGNTPVPSAWMISNQPSSSLQLYSTLRLRASQLGRDLSGFGNSFAHQRNNDSGKDLACWLESLTLYKTFDCPFSDQLKEALPPGRMVVFARLLRTLAALRVTLGEQQVANAPSVEVCDEDYLAARALVTGLPLEPVDREVSSQSLRTGTLIYENTRADESLEELPDRSDAGQVWFTRAIGIKCTDLSYNTIKKHLAELEGEGICQSTVAQSNREQGKQVHYRFSPGRAPPFLWKNPFEALPKVLSLSKPHG